MNYLRYVIALVALFVCGGAHAQWQVPLGEVPIGRGAGVGFMSSAGVDTNILVSKTANYTIAATDCGKTIQAGTGSTGFFTLTFPSVSGFSTVCSVKIVNGDTGRGKAIAGLTGITKLYPGQTMGAKIVNGAWMLFDKPTRWLIPNGSSVTLFLNKDNGVNTNDCLGTGATGACATSAQIMTDIATNMDVEGTITIQWGCSATPCTFTDVPFNAQSYVGTGAIILQGDTTTPTNFVMQCVTTCVAIPAQIGRVAGVFDFAAGVRGYWTVQGFKVTASLANVSGIRVWYAPSMVFFQSMNFGSLNGGSQLLCISGASRLEDISGSTSTISGGAGQFVTIFDGCISHINGTYTVSGTPAYTTFAYTEGAGALLGISGANFTGAATGQRCLANNMSYIATGGGFTTLPGSTACSATPGGIIN